MDKSFFSIDEIYNKGLVSLRIRNTLHRAKIFDTYHLARLNDKDLKKLPSVGAKTFNELTNTMRSHEPDANKLSLSERNLMPNTRF